jgi:uncharacterized DUF497 family protein
MRFEWDETKRRSNLKRHGFDFLDAERIFASETFSLQDDRFDYGEIRVLTIGILSGRVVAVVHTQRGELTRIISIRKALKNEEETYFKEVRN